MNTNTTLAIADMNYAQLLEFVKGHPVFAKRIKERDEEGLESEYMIATFSWNSDKGDASITKYFHPFLNKYYPGRYKVGEEFQEFLQRHELGMVKAVVEYEIHYAGKFPKSQTYWTLAFIQGPAYALHYVADGDSLECLDKEVIEDNIFTIENRDIGIEGMSPISRMFLLEQVISVVRNYPDFNDGGPLADMMDAVLAGKDSELVNFINTLGR